MALRLYNTLGRQLQDFIPIHAGKAGFYGCGPTVYNFAHIGNLRAYVFLDILDRTLTYLGYDITHVMNITDIGHLSGDADEGEDKMVKTAKDRGQSVLEIAQFYTDAFFGDIDRLNIRRPDVVCKATEHVPDMIELIKRIEANGHTYTAGGNLYFDVSTFPSYGDLAGLNLDDLKAGARIDIDRNKRNPFDFVLWFTKSKFENQALVWDSPWGRGYPGWHIECSAMSMKYLGEQFDIHTGGIDHIPIHHTNEIAQSEGATGKKWVNYWLHNEFLVIAKDKESADGGAGKMSKSSGNFLTLQSLVDKGYDALDYRFFLLGAHYRSQVAFSWAAMDGAKNARKALVQRVAKVLARSAERVQTGAGLPTKKPSARAHAYLDKFTAALENDLATPQALSALQTAVKDAELAPEEVVSLVQRMDSVLALDLLKNARQLLADETAAAVTDGSDPEAKEIQALIEERTAAKKAKNYARADEIRTELNGRGIILEDTPQGTVWKRA
ncbi:cysteine--tRNA ligase [Treponema brennaborense]|uniref:Cysteine--tRNA ligase n=1 Tax=Treponema brennaborense (strain DSM 12168 / CIP 105900 / DD5/3) TaxID=906968 RepID=F4LNQ1_TREBD|nr:cysteine--tRNA ligase [Treponema brennaborense]AEE16886.1 cysteinyl-tRNA synthetase [Treponema brennaborense DSM 12168]